MEMIKVLRHQDDNVAEIVLDRPEAMNSINSSLARALIRAFAEKRPPTWPGE